MTALIYFMIAAIVIAVVVYILILLWDWICSLIPMPGPIAQIVRILIIVIGVLAILYRLAPILSHLV